MGHALPLPPVLRTVAVRFRARIPKEATYPFEVGADAARAA